jgi:hypothetical protein
MTLYQRTYVHILKTFFTIKLSLFFRHCKIIFQCFQTTSCPPLRPWIILRKVCLQTITTITFSVAHSSSRLFLSFSFYFIFLIFISPSCYFFFCWYCCYRYCCCCPCCRCRFCEAELHCCCCIVAVVLFLFFFSRRLM